MWDSLYPQSFFRSHISCYCKSKAQANSPNLSEMLAEDTDFIMREGGISAAQENYFTLALNELRSDAVLASFAFAFKRSTHVLSTTRVSW